MWPLRRRAIDARNKSGRDGKKKVAFGGHRKWVYLSAHGKHGLSNPIRFSDIGAGAPAATTART